MRFVRLVSVLAAAAVAAAFAGDRARAAPEIGEAAPPLVLTALDGTVIDLAKLRGKVVLVNFWATWCAPCRKEMPTFDVFYRRHRGENLELVGISIDFARDAAKMRKAAAPFAYPIAWINDAGVNGFGAPDGVPVTYVIDADGIIRDKFIAVPGEAPERRRRSHAQEVRAMRRLVSILFAGAGIALVLDAAARGRRDRRLEPRHRAGLQNLESASAAERDDPLVGRLRQRLCPRPRRRTVVPRQSALRVRRGRVAGRPPSPASAARYGRAGVMTARSSTACRTAAAP